MGLQISYKHKVTNICHVVYSYFWLKIKGAFMLAAIKLVLASQEKW